MKKIMISAAVSLLVVLTSCTVIISTGPALAVSVDFAGSNSYDGYYEIDLAIENVGGGKAYIEEDLLGLFGSNGASIDFTVYGTSVRDLNPGETQYLTLYGYTTVYVPYEYTVRLEYGGEDGIPRTAETSGSFIIGDPGDPFIAYSWTSGPFTFSTDDPGIPDVIYNGQYYGTYPGTYWFTYQAWDGSVWTGYYTIYRDTGGAGSDGDDTYFELACYNTGPILYVWEYAASAKTSAGKETAPAAKGLSSPAPTVPAEAETVDGTAGQFRYSITSWKLE